MSTTTITPPVAASAAAVRLVFFSPTERYSNIIDTVEPDGRGKYGGQTKAELELVYGPLEILGQEDAVSRVEKMHTKEPVEITKERFWHFLEVLPPCKWSHPVPGCEAFHVSERITYSIVTWCVRIAERYFSVDCSDKLQPAQVVNLVAVKFFPQQVAA